MPQVSEHDAGLQRCKLHTHVLPNSGQPAVVSYAGASPGAVAGLVQINAIMPPTVRTGAAIGMTVSIGSAIASRRFDRGHSDRDQLVGFLFDRRQLRGRNELRIIE